MRILTRPELHAADPDMTRIMAFHDRLVHSRLLALLPAVPSVPLRLAFDNRVLLSPLDEEARWTLCDRHGHAFPQVELSDMVGCPVTGIGYMQDPAHLSRPAIPYIQFINQVFVCCWSAEDGCAVRHDRPREDAWDVFPQLRLE